MCAALLFTCGWWIGLSDLHTVAVWSGGSVTFYFSVAAGIYLNVRLMSPRLPERGEIDPRAFHGDEGRNAGLGQGGSASQWPAQNIVIIPMTIATATAAILIRHLWVQAFAVAN